MDFEAVPSPLAIEPPSRVKPVIKRSTEDGRKLVDDRERIVAVVGLGYVGLPLATEFGNSRPTIGFDIDPTRIAELAGGHDRTLEVSAKDLMEARNLSFTADEQDLDAASIYVVTVPTPVDAAKRPDFRPLESASELVGRHLSEGDVVVYESTVYPGATEGVCVPILERESGLRLNEGFFVGYSPERINPGDKQHRLTSITKITSGSTPEAAKFIDDLYGSVIEAGTHLAPSIQVAEAAKVIENVQRDVNIALINELAVLFNKLGIDTHAVLEAAGTKWNFLKFTPGLVGGHCIGVDPYYLTHRAQEVGHHPEVILAGRQINDSMGAYVAEQVILLMSRRRVNISESRVLILGLAFKENCPDIRNTRVIDVYRTLLTYGIDVDVYDPWVDADEALRDYGLALLSAGELTPHTYDAVIHAVAHTEFQTAMTDVRGFLRDPGVVFDVKGTLPYAIVDARL